jgi:tetratricopeptide (TPR) repeat protein
MNRLPALLAACLIAAGPLVAQQPRLGTIDFPTSGGPAAEAAFVRGVLYLHSFEYASAASAFREAQQLEPGFAMAYWGEAMTYDHPLWNEHDRPAAQAVLDRLAPTAAARQATAPTDRERRYLGAVELLYNGEGSKARRDTLYAGAMQALSATYPADADAEAFYALSLLGLSQGERNVATYMRAGAIALSLMQRYPDHPGAAHYAIHSFDDPDHAPLGLPAARAYSGIAPDAPHAQHMTTHIFLALGMWNEVVSQNVIAVGPDSATWMPGHYTEWLHYALLQLGRTTEADSLLALVMRNAGTNERRSRGNSAVMMRAAQIINGAQWTGPLVTEELATPNNWRGMRAADAFATGYAALQRSGDASAALARLEALVEAPSADGDDTQPGTVRAIAKSLAAASAFHAGRREEALALILEAEAYEDALAVEFGPPTVVKPTHELHGEMLLAMGRPAEAEKAFARALAMAPNRLLSLRGMAAAAAAAGDQAAAERATLALPKGGAQ